MNKTWLSSPAIVWDVSSHQAHSHSSYWNVEPLSTILQETQDNQAFLAYRDVFYLVTCLAERIHSTIRPVLAAASDLQAKDLIVPVAVAVPEGFLLPLSIAGVHAANLPCFYKTNHRFSVALVPLDPTEGRDRIKCMLQDAKPTLVLTAAECDRKQLEEITSTLEYTTGDNGFSQGIHQCKHSQLFDLIEWLQEVMGQYPDEDRRRTIVDRILCGMRETGTFHEMLSGCLRELSTLPLYEDLTQNRISHIVYTSGTTGVPKGCISSIRSLENYIRSKNQVHQISRGSIILLASTLSFDPCLSDVLATFTAQATLAIAPRDHLRRILPNVLKTLRVTHCLCTPTLWGSMTSMGAEKEDFPMLQVVALGGERIPSHIVRIWARKDASDTTTNLRLCSTFGVTEACVYQTFGEVFQTDTERPGQDIGDPFPGLGVRICVESDQTALIEAEEPHQSQPARGEIVVFGNQLDELSGYFDRPGLRHKFIFDDGHYHYRTGDRGFVDMDSKHLHVLGRILGEDGMVKFNGIRMELGEIESALMDRNDESTIIVDSMVSMTSRDDTNDSSTVKGLVGYVVLSRSCLKELNISVPESGILCAPGPLLTLLRERCKVRAKVTPSAFVIIPNIPISPTGKRFRKGLPLLSDSTTLDQLHKVDADGNAVVQLRTYGKSGAVIADQIVDCLNLQPCQEALLTTQASFAMLGGDSLAATRVTRALFALHHNVNNSRLLGGDFGVLDGPFAAIHLLLATNLRAYADWLDQHDMNWSKGTGLSVAAQAQDSESRSNKSHSLKEAEAAHLYDALLQAVTRGETAVSLALLDVGADPNFDRHKGRLGKTSGRMHRKRIFRTSPMHLACLKGLPPVVEKILQKGDKCNSPDASGLFPIHLAASGESAVAPYSVAEDRRRLQCIKLLLQAGVPITMKDGNKQTILHAAARAGYHETLRYIMTAWKETICIDPSMQDSINWRDNWSRTPVHWAVLNGKVDALGVLLEMGCSPNPPKPKSNGKRSSAAVESPEEINERVYGSSDTGLRMEALLTKIW